jgi:hypothetical protein
LFPLSYCCPAFPLSLPCLPPVRLCDTLGKPSSECTTSRRPAYIVNFKGLVSVQCRDELSLCVPRARSRRLYCPLYNSSQDALLLLHTRSHPLQHTETARALLTFSDTHPILDFWSSTCLTTRRSDLPPLPRPHRAAQLLRSRSSLQYLLPSP